MEKQVLPSLAITINVSVGNKKNHITTKGLCDLFLNIKNKKNDLNSLEKYAIKIIKTEAYPEEIEWFKKDYNIPQENIDYLLSINPYKTEQEE